MKTYIICSIFFLSFENGALYNNIYLLQLGCQPMAVVILHVYKIWNWLLINLSPEGYMRSMYWQLGMLGTVWVFAYRHRETEKNLCRNGRSQDLPNTDFLKFLLPMVDFPIPHGFNNQVMSVLISSLTVTSNPQGIFVIPRGNFISHILT